ncbi:MAG: N-6 DNA methylase, partial [Methanosarcinales archaeon]|nr:N-6 DNA methylase [Methanosarcinales archaeon]
ICEKVKISDEVLGGIIEDMSKRSFRKFDFDILGNTYETYLGHTLHLKKDGTVELKPSQETRKESGIYYTPPYVVDYIVKNTLGAMLAGKTPDEVAKIRVLDPACGSGSFLIKTFDYFSDYYRKEGERIRAEKERRVKEYLKLSGNQLSLDFENGVSDEYLDVEYGILVNNLHGVDLDEQACEIAAVNLMLKGLRAGGRMPLVLGETIKVGNSLISGGEELSGYFGDGWKDKKPFNWEEEFGAEGFDVVVGNPPWVSFGLRGVSQVAKEMNNYLRDMYPHSAEYKLSVYAIFINRAIDRLSDGGIFGFIVPDSFLLGRYFSKVRRYILDTTKVKEILLFLEDFWPHGTVGRSVIILLQKESDEEIRRNNEVTVRLCPTLGDLSEEKFKTHSYNQDYFEKVLYNRFRLFFDEESKRFVDKIESSDTTLNTLVDIYSGCIGRYGQDSIISDHKNDGIAIKNKKGDIVYEDKNIKENWKPLLESGGDIGKYSIDYKGKYIYFEEDVTKRSIYAKSGFEKEKYIGTKLFLRQTGDSLISTYDPDGYFCINNMHVINIKSPEIKYDLRYILAIINSKLMNHYYHLISLELGRVMAQTDIETIEQLPIAPANPDEQKPIIELVDCMIAFNKELHKINIDFDRYLNLHPRIKDTTLREYIDVLLVADKEVMRDHKGNPASKIEEKIKEFEITEKGEWLVFSVGYLFKSGKGKETLIRIDAFKCRIEDVKLRKFLYYSIKAYTRPGTLGKGNIYERLLAIRLPQFYADAGRNAEAVSEIMTEYLAAVDAAERVEREIAETDQEIDAQVYELYGLGVDEIKVVEKNY